VDALEGNVLNVVKLGIKRRNVPRTSRVGTDVLTKLVVTSARKSKLVLQLSTRQGSCEYARYFRPEVATNSCQKPHYKVKVGVDDKEVAAGV